MMKRLKNYQTLNISIRKRFDMVIKTQMFKLFLKIVEHQRKLQRMLLRIQKCILYIFLLLALMLILPKTKILMTTRF